MLKIIVSFFIFCLVLFFYIHIQYHLKKSNELEIYEIDTVYKDKIDEICDLRQPVIFNVENSKLIENTNKEYLTKQYSVFNVNIRNIKDIHDEDDLYIPFALNLANTLFDEDKDEKFITENNFDFLQETGTIKNIQHNDQLFRPPLVSNCNYDFLSGSKNTVTPFRYDLNYRNYFIVTQNEVNVKLAPPKSIKYLHSIDDYENFEFKSPINPWNTQTQYLNDFDKIKCLEIKLTKGKCIFIPAFWWYSFKYETNNSSILSLKYRTYMNNVTIFPQIFLSILQNQNIVRNYVKKIENIKTNKEKQKIEEQQEQQEQQEETENIDEVNSEN